MPILTGASYVAAVALTVLFIQTFDIWQMLSTGLGRDRAAFIPFIVLGGVLVVAMPWRWQRRQGGGGSLGAPICSILLALLGLAMTDPQFPAKRIHVAEFILLSFLIRFGASRIASGTPLTLITALLTALLGVHDEMIQGLHPDRTFGVRDMAVDSVAALAGALMGHRRGRQAPAPGLAGWGLAILFLLAVMGLQLWVLAAGLSFIGPTGPAPPPLWAAAPLLGMAGAVALLAPPAKEWPGHLGAMVLILTASTSLYLVVPHVAPLAFR